MNKIASNHALFALASVLVFFSACGGGGGGSGGGGGGSSLKGVWFGAGYDDQVKQYGEYRVVVDESRNITSVAVDGVDQGITGTIEKTSSKVVFEFSLSNGTKGGFILDGGRDYAFLASEFGGLFAVLQKGAGSLPGYAPSDLFDKTYSGIEVAVDDDFVLAGTSASSAEVFCDGGFSGTSGAGSFTHAPGGQLAFVDVEHGVWAGEYESIGPSGFSSGDVTLLMSPDKRFVGARACDDMGSYPADCGFFAWNVGGVGSGGGGGGGGSGGGSGSTMEILSVSNGFGEMIPHRVYKPDPQGNPTSEIVAIRSHADLLENVLPTNPILAPAEWPATTILPNGDAGNHFVYAEFTQPLDIERVLDNTPSGQANSGLTGTITVLAIDPSSGNTIPVKGRAFVGGRTYSGVDPGNPFLLQLQQWVLANGNGKPVASNVDGSFPGLGFPGTESCQSFSGVEKLTQDNVFVFVADDDGNLSTHETFPANRQIKIRATIAVLSKSGGNLGSQVLGASTVGPDVIAPEVSTTPPPNSFPVTVPAFADTNVDPETTIRIEFTEPIQPWSVGSLPTGLPPVLSSAISVSFGPPTKVVNVPFEVLPISVYDLSLWELTPAFSFPGSGPSLFQCGVFNRVTLTVSSGQLQDLRANLNQLPASTYFDIGAGPGLVNAPVTPDAIYVGRLGADPGVSVIDLNGFGQGTGNPSFDFTYTSFPKGWSNFPNDPNLILQGSVLRPPLAPGTCTLDGGSAGPFTVTLDSALDELLLRSPLVTSIGDMALGQALERVFNNGLESIGCQAGGGNLCAIKGKKLIQVAFSNPTPSAGSVPANEPTLPVVGLQNTVPGGANVVSWAPHPNPPPLVFPPLCASPFIGAQEPTSFEVVQDPNIFALALGRTNLLKPGNYTGNPLGNPPVAPSGIMASQQNIYFQGPSPIRMFGLGACIGYMTRQQVGQFLYVIDRARAEVVVVNSNRFTVLERIPVSDPTDLAMGPNLDLLAVSNQSAGTVSFIDVNPSSSTFHEVVKTTKVGNGPRGIAWDPGNEDILVCNEADSSLSIISAASLEVRKTVSSHLTQPFDVVIHQRQFNFGFFRNVYFAFILNRNGDLAVFESGPNGLNGWGYDDVIGTAPFIFEKPKKIALDFTNIAGSAWILHENQLNPDGTQTGLAGGAATNVYIESSIAAAIPLVFNSLPQFRQMTLNVAVSIGPSTLTGIPVDLALDDLVNHGGLENLHPVQAAGTPQILNGKSVVRAGYNGGPVPAKFPSFMFLAIPSSTEGPGVVDVIGLQPGFPRVDTDPYLPGLQSIPVPGVNVLMDYWRQ